MTTKPIGDRHDVVILGGTPGGIAAALAAARLGCSVTLIETHAHVGGMSASGLGKSDVEKRHLIGGIFREFTTRIHQDYERRHGVHSDDVRLCQQGFYFEPSVASRVFEEMLTEQPGIQVLCNHRLTMAEVRDRRLTAIRVEPTRGGEPIRLSASVFIDATYEGDLLAVAGADYRSGREARSDFDEPHAGVVYYDYQNRVFLPGSTGDADDRLPAYTYRLCLTTDAANAYKMSAPPADYDRRIYTGYFDDLYAGRLSGPKVFKPGRGYHLAHFDTLLRALSVTEIPGAKTDVNINPRPLALPFGEENRDYLLADATTRQRICERHRLLTLGLLWFLQNDEQVPELHRDLANGYHLPLDEFTDNEHFPFQLYVREGRRLVGEVILTEHDITMIDDPGEAGGMDKEGDIQTGSARSSRCWADSIAVGEFPIDSFPCRKRQQGDTVVLEGYLGMLDHITRPYEIPYRIMIPQKLDGLIVPVAASTTHVAYSSIRMEPTWMALGQAAGSAAYLATREDVPPRAVPIAKLQQQLLKDGQVLAHQRQPGD